MGSERLRLIAAALLWTGAGAVGMGMGDAARGWAAAAVLLALGAAVAVPLARARTAVPLAPEPPLPDATLRLRRVQAWLEHLPVAAWVMEGERLTPLSSRAHRLQAPGGVRELALLQQHLRTADAGPVLLDTERGQERWQLQRQTLALDGEAQALLVLVPLENALEAESLQAWQQLVQVLTHEIMNSLTPVQSLSHDALALLDEPGPDAPPELRLALDAIARRAQGLAAFVGNYRRVSQWPAPVLAPVELSALFARLERTVGAAWRARGGQARFELSAPTLRLQADEGHLEQALLALLRNAEQATAATPEPRLWVQASLSRGGRLRLSVRDNGPGVPPGLERQIFLPFFSAREPGPDGEAGQGIGLTVVRRLVHGMGGRVRHVRPLEGGAAFVLSF
jgi:signal transduction histidine kinase